MTLQHMLVPLLFGYPLPPEMVDPRFPIFLQRASGLMLTLLITVLSLTIGAGMGVALALCRREDTKKFDGNVLNRLLTLALRSAATALVEVVRALPIMLLILLTFYLPYRMVEVRFPSVILAIAAFSLYAGVYLSEIMRAGFRSIDSELRHVARVLGLTQRQILLRIELPLICHNMKPDLINLAVTLFKDTSTLAMVAVPELTYIGRQMLVSKPMQYELVLLIILVLYWVPATILSAFAFRAEQKRVNLRRSADLSQISYSLSGSSGPSNF
jgi:His/Glu/Gln/Arg/opine family amino acid ABC transporter permease subunit